MDTSWLLPLALVSLGLIINAVITWRLWSHYNRLTNKVAKKELMDVLNELLKSMDNNEKKLEKLDGKFAEYKEWNRSGLRRIGFMRYNPFADTGGNQSFCLAVLDANNNGFMISSLHSRENTRLYSKVVAKGKVKDQNLSKEEQQVLNQALKQ